MRDTKKEYSKSKEIYEPIFARVDKSIGVELKKTLEKENKSLASWITENAKRYLNK